MKSALMQFASVHSNLGIFCLMRELIRACLVCKLHKGPLCVAHHVISEHDEQEKRQLQHEGRGSLLPYMGSKDQDQTARSSNLFRAFIALLQ